MRVGFDRRGRVTGYSTSATGAYGASVVQMLGLLLIIPFVLLYIIFWLFPEAIANTSWDPWAKVGVVLTGWALLIGIVLGQALSH
jgi:hypothetical protein